MLFKAKWLLKRSTLILSILFVSLGWIGAKFSSADLEYVVKEINPHKGDLRLFWKDANGSIYGNAQSLKQSVESDGFDLQFAMNGGMYLKDQSPQGLYIEDGELFKQVNRTKEAYGNFYLQPNGIFYLTKKGEGRVSTTESFKLSDDIAYATQSGPMLVIDGEIHKAFTTGSKNTHIRNGVGVLKNGNLLFAMSKHRVNLYDFANYFKSKGCKNALYLDGFVSRTYLPEENCMQMDGNFGVIIGLVKAK